MDSDKGRTPPCGIYLHIKDVSEKEKLLRQLREFAMVINRASTYDQNMHVVSFAYDGVQVLALRELVEAMRMAGIVTIVDGGRTGFESAAADGVLVFSMEEVAAVRPQIGEEAILGLDARDVKMEIKELALTGADFAILPADLTKLASWVMLTDKPCVVSGRMDNDNCGDYAAAGASFVDVSEYILNHKKGVMQGTVNILHALELALKVQPQKN